MLFRVVDSNYNVLTTFLDENLIDDERHILLQGSTYMLTFPTDLDGSEHIIEGNMILFYENGENQIYTIMAITDENEFQRTIACESFDTALNGDIANSYPMNKPQRIEYFLNREFYNTNWSILMNEIPTKKALPDCTGTGDTKKARLFAILDAFEVEAQPVYDFRNSRLTNAFFNIFQHRGNDLSNSVVLRVGDDVQTINRTTDNYTTYTEVKVVGNGSDITKIKYDDGTYYTTEGSNIIYNRVAKTERNGQKVMGYFESDSDIPATIFVQGLAYLKENDETKVNYEVTVISGMDSFQVADYVTIIDNERKPAIRIKARVLEKFVSVTNPSKNKATFGNFETLKYDISAQVLAVQKQMKQLKDQYTATIVPSDGTVFIEGEERVVSLTATVFKNGEDVTDQLSPSDFWWYKIEKDGSHDTTWESSVLNAGKTVNVSNFSVTDVSLIRLDVNDRQNVLVQQIYFLNGLKDLAYRVGQIKTESSIVLAATADNHCARNVINKADIRGNILAFNHVKNIAEFSNMTDLDFTMALGDMVDGRTTKRQNTQDLQEVMANFGESNCPYFFAVGNHDDNRYGNRASGNVMNQFIEPHEMYSIVTSPSKAFGIKENEDDKNMYYYYDLPGKNFRIFVLNCFDTPYTSTNGAMDYIDKGGYRAKQINWLISALQSTPNDYHVAFFQHVSLGTGYNDSNLNYVYNTDIVQGIVGAYKNGSSYAKTSTHKDFAVSVNVTFNRPHVVAFVANGHHHADRLKVVNGINNLSINLSNPDSRQAYWGTLLEDSWVSVIINPTLKKVSVLRFGYGNDLEFLYT